MNTDRSLADHSATIELVDTHCHITSGILAAQVDNVIARADQAGVTRLVVVACDPKEWDQAAALRDAYPGRVWSAFGIHPHDASIATPAMFDRLSTIASEPGIVAGGEMGLDYHYDFSPRPAQRAVFSQQLKIARNHDWPIIIHSREAHTDVVRMLLDEGFTNRRVVFHCFSGNRDEAAELRNHGWWASFTGIVTFSRSGEMQAVCRETPIDQLMFETDAPYLSPEPVRRMRPNEPANLVHTVRFAAGLRHESFEQLAAISTANAIRFFSLQNAELPNHSQNSHSPQNNSQNNLQGNKPSHSTESPPSLSSAPPASGQSIPCNSPDGRRWLLQTDSQLLAQCEIDLYRASGPGGQKRNKTSSAVRLRHAPTGVIVTAVESRSQHENKARALVRLRRALAFTQRHCSVLPTSSTSPTSSSPTSPTSPASQTSLPEFYVAAITRDPSLHVNPRHPQYLLIVQYILDVLHLHSAAVSETAASLQISTGQLIRFLKEDDDLWHAANRMRQEFNLGPLH